MTVIPINDYSPIFAGDTGNPLSIYVAQENGFKHIVGATIAMKMRNTDTGAIKTCGPNWTIDPLDNGRASYVYQVGDVDVAGDWELWISITISGKAVHVDDGAGNPIILQILPLPTGV